MLPVGSPLAADWTIASDRVVFLNHGAHGACPRSVLLAQQTWQQQMEAQPLQFFRDLEAGLDQAASQLGAFLGTSQDHLAWQTNATTAVNTVLRSLAVPAADGWAGWRVGDEIVTTDHCYNACRNALDYLAGWLGVKVVVANVPFPLSDRDEITSAIANCFTKRTKLVLVDAITSPSALIFPLDAIAAECDRVGIDLLVDGAHEPGMQPISLESLGVAYYAGNAHKWLCAPKGAGFLYVRPDRQNRIRPLTISHGANAPRTDRSRFLLEFGWQGTDDPSPWLAVATAIDWLGHRLSGGWDEIYWRNRELALTARRLLCDRLQIDPPAPEESVGAMASLILENITDPVALQARLLAEWAIEVPVFPATLIGGKPSQAILRISAQIYNAMEQYDYLAHALRSCLAD